MERQRQGPMPIPPAGTQIKGKRKRKAKSERRTSANKRTHRGVERVGCSNAQCACRHNQDQDQNQNDQIVHEVDPSKKKLRSGTERVENQKGSGSRPSVGRGNTQAQSSLLPSKKLSAYPLPVPVLSPQMLDQNWEYWRILSEEMYTFLNDSPELSADYLSEKIIGKRNLEKGLNGPVSVLVVRVNKLSDMFFYGRNQKRLILETTDLPTANTSTNNSANGNSVKRKICALGSLADLMHSVVKIEDLLVVVCGRLDGSELMVLNAPAWQMIPQAQTMEDNKVTIGHYRHVKNFSLHSDSDSGNENSDCFTIARLLQDSQYESETHEISNRENRVMFRPSMCPTAIAHASESDSIRKVVFRKDRVKVVANVEEAPARRTIKTMTIHNRSIHRQTVKQNKNSNVVQPTEPAITNEECNVSIIDTITILDSTDSEPEQESHGHGRYKNHKIKQSQLQPPLPSSAALNDELPPQLFGQSHSNSPPRLTRVIRDDLQFDSINDDLHSDDSIMADLQDEDDNSAEPCALEPPTHSSVEEISCNYSNPDNAIWMTPRMYSEKVGLDSDWVDLDRDGDDDGAMADLQMNQNQLPNYNEGHPDSQCAMC